MTKKQTVEIEHILKNTFHLSSFRHIQLNILESIISKNNTFGIMPTGGGKSLIYQIAGLYLGGTTIVISPLISLMENQVNFLKSKNIKAAFYNTSLTEEEKIVVIKQIENKELHFLFISPERLFIHEQYSQCENFLDYLLKHVNINLIAIDEAHCISSWGHDFREDYLKLKKIQQKLPQVPILLLTATADILTQKEIIDSFNISQQNVFTMPIERTNIEYNIEQKNFSGYEQCLKIIKSQKDLKGIVYCFKKVELKKLVALCKKSKIKAEPYHADLKEQKKKEVLQNFIDDKIDVVIATIAFGMGIDKPNIRYVIHKDCPKTLEGYYQETGRVGRDGKPSRVWFLYSKKDMLILNWISSKSNQSYKEKIKLNLVKQFVHTSMCRKQVLNWYFENKIHDNCGTCDNCKKTKQLIQLKDFLHFLNELLIGKIINLFDIENILNTHMKFKSTIEQCVHTLYQLIFEGLIDYDRKNNTITIAKNNNLDINKKVLLIQSINNNINIKDKEKIITTRKRKTTTKKVSTTKTTTKSIPKKTTKSIPKKTTKSIPKK